MTSEWSSEIEKLNVYSMINKESNNNQLFEFIMANCITYALPEEAKYPEMSSFVKKVQTHHHTTTSGKKMGVACRYNAP